MFEWKVKDMALMNQSRIGREKIYLCESNVSREDKIAFIDSMTDGKLSYILELAKKYKEEKDTLKQDKWGKVNTNSFKAWLRKNDIKNVVDREYWHGRIYFLSCERNIKNIDVTYRYDIYKDYVDEIFHRQLIECERMEKRYFLEHDEYSILKRKFRERNYHTTFGVHIADWSSGKLTIVDDNDDDNERDITIDELKELLAKYEQLDKLVEKLTAETHIVY